MAAEHGDALTCDFAEYYHVLDWRRLPVRVAATLAGGLPAGSRTAREMSGTRRIPEDFLLAAIADRLGLLVWMQTKDGHKGRNRPRGILDELVGKGDARRMESYRTAREFEAAWARATGRR